MTDALVCVAPELRAGHLLGSTNAMKEMGLQFVTAVQQDSEKKGMRAAVAQFTKRRAPSYTKKEMNSLANVLLAGEGSFHAYERAVRAKIVQLRDWRPQNRVAGLDWITQRREEAVALAAALFDPASGRRVGARGRFGAADDNGGEPLQLSVAQRMWQAARWATRQTI